MALREAFMGKGVLRTLVHAIYLKHTLKDLSTIGKLNLQYF